MCHFVQPPTQLVVGEGSAHRDPIGLSKQHLDGGLSITEHSGGWGESGQMAESETFYKTVALRHAVGESLKGTEPC